MNNDNVYLLDTRTIDEFNISHLKGARFINYKSFNLNDIVDIPQNAIIILYCSVGYRSEKIGEKLLKDGYKNVFNLYGGIFEWIYYDKSLVNKKGETTSKVHTYDEEWSKWLIKGEKVY